MLVKRGFYHCKVDESNTKHQSVGTYLVMSAGKEFHSRSFVALCNTVCVEITQ